MQSPRRARLPPINVLLGSHKFAGGWNCYRVSIIGLVNLGSSKGNKIIQIFGWGISLKGLKAGGKRRFIEHAENYGSLIEEDTAENRLRRMETVNVFSIDASCLTAFLAVLNAGFPVGPWSAASRLSPGSSNQAMLHCCPEMMFRRCLLLT